MKIYPYHVKLTLLPSRRMGEEARRFLGMVKWTDSHDSSLSLRIDLGGQKLRRYSILIRKGWVRPFLQWLATQLDSLNLVEGEEKDGRDNSDGRDS